ncbi:MAG: methyltransferase domain-containing protein [Patescibacteria group bacterium]
MSNERPQDRFKPVSSSRVFNRILTAFDLRTKKVLDLGCAYGEHLVHFGPGSLGITTTLDEVEYGARHGLHIAYGNVESLNLSEDFSVIWANNLFEHLLSPHAFLMRLKRSARPETLLILGVPVIPKVASLLRLKKFRGSLAVAHINFFTRESLRLTVERAGWRVREIRPFQFGNPLIDSLFGYLSPHLYVVAENNLDFAYHEKKLKEWKDDDHYAEVLSIARSSAQPDPVAK